MLVKAILESLGAPAEAVSWAADYGDDMKRAWDECEHPELLIPIAAGAGVPDFDVINATVEVINAHLECVLIHPAMDKGLKIVERFICGEATDDEVLSVCYKMGVLTKETPLDRVAFRSAAGAVAHVCEACIHAEQGCVDGMQARLSTAVMLAAQARTETIAHGCPDSFKADILDIGLRGTAPIVRRYVPYESFVGGFVAGMCVVGEDEEMGRA